MRVPAADDDDSVRLRLAAPRARVPARSRRVDAAGYVRELLAAPGTAAAAAARGPAAAAAQAAAAAAAEARLAAGIADAVLVATTAAAHVYRGSWRNASAARPVAAKQVAPWVRAGPDAAAALAELEHEAAVLRTLPPHPHVLEFLDARPGLLVTGWMAGGTAAALAHTLAAPLAAGDAAAHATVHAVLRQLAAALAHLHGHGCVHGDVAARNVLLADDVATGADAWARVHVRLGDFGQAARLPPRTASVTLPPDARVAVRWAAPEVLRHRRLSPAADVWGLGVVLWELCAGGAVPYAGAPDTAAVLQARLAGTAPPLARPAACPAPLWDCATRWLSDTPARRGSAATAQRRLDQATPRSMP